MTTEYTPTTEAIRIAWSYFNNDTEHWENQHRMAETGLAFDRWLAEHDRAIAEAAWEKGRIAAYVFWQRVDDAAAAGQGVLIPDPVNPHRKDRA